MHPTSDQPTPPVTEFNPSGTRFFAAVNEWDAERDCKALMFPHPGYHMYHVYEWLAPRGYQCAATLYGSPNLGDSRKMALDLAAHYNQHTS